MNILITSIGNKINLLKYFRRALFNEGGGILVGIDSNNFNNGRHYVDHFLLSPPVDDEQYAQWLFNVITEHAIDIVIPSRDGDLQALALLADDIQHINNCFVMVASLDTLATCLDKHVFEQWCLSQKLNVPKSFLVNEVTPSDLPLFIKPKIASAARGGLSVSDWQQWLSISTELNDEHIIQSLQTGTEYSIDVYIDRTGNIVSNVPRTRIITHAGESIHAKVVLKKTVLSAVNTLVSALNLVGHNTVQCFEHQGEVVFIEVNARFGGGFSLGVEAGADTPRYIIQEHKGLLPVAPIISDGLEMLRIQKDVFLNHTQPKTYCFDLDGTLCTEFCAYESAQPVMFMIDKLNALYEQGHKIIIATARGAASGVSWELLVKQQLADWGVNYHQLVMNKPYADYYVDNKSVDILELV